MKESFWNKKRILITGGAGFVGSNLIGKLLNAGSNVRIVDNLERGRIDYITQFLNDIEFVEDDLRHSYVCEKACQGMDVVIHLASKVGGIKYYLDKPGEVLLQSNLMDNLMWGAAVKEEVPFYLYASSAHVYPIELQGSPDSPPIVEEQCYPANPELSYGWGKILGEKLIESSIEEGCPTRAAIMRIIGAYGPNQDIAFDTGSAIPVFIHRAAIYDKTKHFKVLGIGKETRSYCYIDDIAEGLFLAVEKLESSNKLVGPMNLGTEESISIADLVNEVIKISGKDIQLTWDMSHPTAIWGQVLNCQHAKDVLDGWEPKISLSEGLKRCFKDIMGRLDRKDESHPS